MLHCRPGVEQELFGRAKEVSLSDFVRMSFTSWHLNACFHPNAIGRVLGGHKVPLPKGANAARQEIGTIKAGSQG